MPYFTTTVAYGVMLATGGLLVAGSLLIFMVVLRDDRPKIGGDRDPAPLGWPIDSRAETPEETKSPRA